jgi:hypothetical protein
MTTSILFRLAAPVLALCLAGPALADAKGSGGNTAMADCAGRADIAWIQAQSLCPPGPASLLQSCLAKAAMDHAAALIACERENSAAISGGTRKSTGADGLKLAAPRLGRGMPQLAGPSSLSRFSVESSGLRPRLGRR